MEIYILHGRPSARPWKICRVATRRDAAVAAAAVVYRRFRVDPSCRGYRELLAGYQPVRWSVDHRDRRDDDATMTRRVIS